MKNDLGYIYNKPFISVDDTEEKQAIFNLNDDSLEVKVKDIFMFDPFDRIKKFGELVEKEICYGINSKGFPLTLYNTSVLNTSYRAISHSTLNSEMYIIGKQYDEKIKHFTEETKIREIIYYNDDLINIFGNRVVKSEEKRGKNNKFKSVKYNGKGIKKTILDNIILDNYSLKLVLVESFSFQVNYKTNEHILIPKTYLSIIFSKGLCFDEIYKIRKRIDSVVHLMTFGKKRNKTLELKCYGKKSYIFDDLKIKNDDVRSIYRLNNGVDKNENFIKLFKTLISIKEEDSNSFFPFLNYDRPKISMEIHFLEYYRVLEFMNIISQKKKKKGKNDMFLLPLIKKYSELTNKYFPNCTEEVIEEEIRNLRNYYSHYGYYIKKLRIPTDENKPLKYFKSIDSQWIYNATMFLKSLAYLEIYLISDISILEKDIIFSVHRI